ncbi:unnamed protein product [Cyclocybe aegerita]|uniref:Carboxylesterase type B domain-containing protein n=1 Tax=Cyclocybe aegerita TaxID=1973307 RepID=A0A8S0WCB9_CYCAE|nr:unnamed protein product [Cyclocybe aegerita]
MGSSLALVAALLIFSVVHRTRSAPSPTSIGSDLQFLFQNDLDWPSATQHNGTIFLSTPSTNAQSLAACNALSEGLLSTSGQHFKNDIKALMRYLVFDSQASPVQRFWVASSSTNGNGEGESGAGDAENADGGCQAIAVGGAVESVRCDSRLPAFCSQSAPYRRNTATDQSERFRVQVQSEKSTFVGTRDALSFRFVGIPYAAPFARFSYSTPYNASSPTTFNAVSYGSPCLQPTGGSEDCLFLNIQTPFLPANVAQATRAKMLKPVLFWIHGGGFIDGEGSDGVFDGGNLASRSDIVVVSINYRVGTLGFLALNDGVTNGNFGIADQITALQWVRTHIAAFGGDPTRITIAGQSAGAGSVRALLGSPPAFGLFGGAIAQSNLGGFGYATTYTEYLSIETQYNSFAKDVVSGVGCGNATDVLGCLRRVNATALIMAPNAPRYIVIDGKYIRNSHLAVNGRGPTAPAHIIFGWTRDDGSDFVGSFPNTRSTLVGQLTGAGMSADVASKVLARPDLFPLPTGHNATMNLYNLTSRVGTDGQFLCIDQATLISSARHRSFPSVYAYQFDRTYAGFEPIPGTCNPPTTAAFRNGDPNLPYFRCHSGELYYTFGTLGQDSRPFRDSADLLLSQVTVDAWSAFVRTFDPNPSTAYLIARGYMPTLKELSRAGKWERVRSGSLSTSGNPVRVLDAKTRNVAWREREQCDLLGYPITMFE